MKGSFYEQGKWSKLTKEKIFEKLNRPITKETMESFKSDARTKRFYGKLFQTFTGYILN